jgi:hypothetical protein
MRVSAGMSLGGSFGVRSCASTSWPGISVTGVGVTSGGRVTTAPASTGGVVTGGVVGAGVLLHPRVKTSAAIEAAEGGLHGIAPSRQVLEARLLAAR